MAKVGYNWVFYYFCRSCKQIIDVPLAALVPYWEDEDNDLASYPTFDCPLCKKGKISSIRNQYTNLSSAHHQRPSVINGKVVF